MKTTNCKICNIKILVFLLLTLTILISAPDDLNPEESFKEARKYAFAEKLDSARIIFNKILEKYPQNYDVRVFLGRTYAWEEKFEKAREQIEQVLSDKNNYKSALQAIVDIELWSENYQKGLSRVNQALKYYPNNTDFLYKKALFLKSLNQNKKAVQAVNNLLNIAPSHEKGQELYQALQASQRPYLVKIQYKNNLFKESDNLFNIGTKNSQRNSWDHISMDLTRRFIFGPVTARLNHASRFDNTGLQYILESYPILRSGTYSYLSIGYSNADIFPQTILGGEIYQRLPYAFEGSIGFRYMDFRSNEIKVITGSFGKYYKNYWFNLKTYLSLNQKGLSNTIDLTLRRYLKGPENYLSLKLGQGVTPGSQINKEEIDYLQSLKIGINGKHRLTSQIGIEWSLEYKNNEIRKQTFLADYGTRVGIEYIF